MTAPSTALRRSYLDASFVVLLLGCAIRIWQWANGRSFWLDEQLVALNIRENSLAGLAGTQDNGTGAPLGWLWIERLSLQLLGEGERALRLSSLVFGLGILVVAWWIGRRWFDRVGSTALVALFALNPAMIAYSDQLKHYAADVFFVLLLIPLAARVVENPHSTRRIIQLWVVGAIGLWFCMGAFLAMPGLALIIVGYTWIRQGLRPFLKHLIPAGIFAISFLSHYQLSLRHTSGNSYLNTLWAFGYPPRGAGIRGYALWFAERLGSLSENPLFLGDLHNVGSNSWIAYGTAALFWLLVATGLLVACRYRLELGFLIGAPILSAVLLSVAHLVPLAVRLTLWMVPSLFIAVAVAIEWGNRSARQAQRQPSVGGMKRVALVLALGLCCVGFLAATVPWAKASTISVLGEPDLNDRAAIEWMVANRKPGDLVLLAAAATDAKRWYDPDSRLDPVRRVGSAPAGAGCDTSALPKATVGYTRVIAYSGVRYIPYLETHQVLGARLAELGRVAETRQYGTLGIVYVVDLTDGPVALGPGPCVVME